jgi:hypothetical protein
MYRLEPLGKPAAMIKALISRTLLPTTVIAASVGMKVESAMPRKQHSR